MCAQTGRLEKPSLPKGVNEARRANLRLAIGLWSIEITSFGILASAEWGSVLQLG